MPLCWTTFSLPFDTNHERVTPNNHSDHWAVLNDFLTPLSQKLFVADVFNNFYNSTTRLHRNKALWLDVPSHVIIFNQSQCTFSIPKLGDTKIDLRHRLLVPFYLEQPLLLDPVSAGIGDVIREAKDSVGINPSEWSNHGSVSIQLLLPVLTISTLTSCQRL